MPQLGRFCTQPEHVIVVLELQLALRVLDERRVVDLIHQPVDPRHRHALLRRPLCRLFPVILEQPRGDGEVAWLEAVPAELVERAGERGLQGDGLKSLPLKGLGAFGLAALLLRAHPSLPRLSPGSSAPPPPRLLLSASSSCCSVSLCLERARARERERRPASAGLDCFLSPPARGERVCLREASTVRFCA